MSIPRLVVTGTDTGIGKTVFAAALAGALGATYWKPVQAGLEDETDSETVARLGSLSPERILPEAYRLKTPASPHLAAEIDGVEIDVAKLRLPFVNGPFVIEGAGGLLVPLTRQILNIEIFARWGLPLVLVARTGLGTINHTLLSLQALQATGLKALGVAFIGDDYPENPRIIEEMSGVKVLGRLPVVSPLDSASLGAAFAANFRVEDFSA